MEVLILKNKSAFFWIILLVVISFLSVITTVILSFFAGSANIALFNIENFNFFNAIPVFLIGLFVSCFIIGIAVLIAARAGIIKIMDYFKENKEDDKK